MKKIGVFFAGILFVMILCSCGNKEDFSALMNQAEQSAKAGKWEEALTFSKKAQKAQPKSPEAIVMTTLAYEYNGKKNEALAEIRKAVKLSPNNYFIQYTYGRILYGFKKNDQSIAALKKAVELRPESVEALSLLARVATEQKDYTTAYHSHKKLIKIKNYPYKVNSWNEIGIYFYQIKKDNKNALAWVNYAYKDKNGRNNPTVILNMAILCDKNNRKPLAKKFYQYYLKLTAKNAALTQKRAAVDARLRKI